MSRLATIGLAAVTLAALARGARAQAVPSPAVELEQFHGSPFFDRTLRLDGTGLLPPTKLSLGLDADYGFRPLVVEDAQNRSYALVRQAVGAELRVALGLTRRLELGALVPVTAYQKGDTLANVAPPAGSGPGAIRVGVKVRLLGVGGVGPGLGASALVAIPTGAAGGLVHENGLGAEANVFGDYRRGALTLGAGAGARLREKTRLYDLALGDELLARVAADVRLDAVTSLFAELASVTALASPWASAKQSPLELLLGGRERFGDLQLFGALGPGLAQGYGTPLFRLVVGGSWSNGSLDVAHDTHDGEGDHAAEPDKDKDGIPDARDKCPSEPETKNGYKDDDGCPDQNPHEVDTDKDGVMDDVDKCPNEPEDKDGFQDDDGCPDPDNDGDGIPDAKDKCPNEPETINNVDDEDGCPDKGIVTLKEGELETLKPIFFATDRARVRHAFRPALDDIAAILTAHPEIGRCAIEGHTDATGPAAWNKKLSFERAKSVAVYLITKGVDPARVVAIGQGEALPWATNQTEAGRAANRRVIFHIEGVSEEQEKKELELQKRRTLERTGAQPAEPPATGPGLYDAPAKAPPPPPLYGPPAPPPPAKSAAPVKTSPAPTFGPPPPAQSGDQKDRRIK
jgi:large repetitive protein